MTTDRIKEIQAETAYPNSASVQQALLKVWNECEQEQKQVKNCSIPAVSGQSELLIAFADWVFDQPKHLGGRERELVAEYLKEINCC